MTLLLLIASLAIQCGDPAIADRIQSVYDEATAILEAETAWNAIGNVTVYCPGIADHAQYNYSITMFGTAIIRERIDLPYYWKGWQFRHELGHAVMTSLYNFRHDYLPGIGEEDDKAYI